MSFGCFGNIHIGIISIYSAVWLLSLNIRFEILCGAFVCSYSLFIVFLCVNAKFMYSSKAIGSSSFLAILNSTVVNIFGYVFWHAQGHFCWDISLLGVKFLGHRARVSSALVDLPSSFPKRLSHCCPYPPAV